MNSEEIIRRVTGAQQVIEKELIQSLWSGYGSIVRYELHDCRLQSVIVKDVRMPTVQDHPRGWNTNRSHERKVQSYQVETAWYQNWSSQCDDRCHVPECLTCEIEGDEVLIVMEDLDSSGFSGRRTEVTSGELRACLSWLAHFHAVYMNDTPDGLWPIGTYWHLDTRPDELEAIADFQLKSCATTIDSLLNACEYKTFVHGDAKVANFCFSPDGLKAAAVDFQYIGGGCGMKDVAYFLSSCLDEDQCEKLEKELLDYYFAELRTALDRYNKDVDSALVEQEWRDMYYLAWADFVRFLKGWSPDHWKIHRYSEQITGDVVKKLMQDGEC